MRPTRLFSRLARGEVHNVRFDDLRRLAEAFGFRLMRVAGSHHIFSHPAVKELINLQRIGTEAKPYQIRQFVALVQKYNLSPEERET